MYTKIESVLVLARLLADKGADRKITIKALKEIRAAVEDEIPSVYVDVTFDSLCNAVHGYSEMFAWEENAIGRAGDASSYYDSKYLDMAFYSVVPDGIREKLLGALDRQNEIFA